MKHPLTDNKFLEGFVAGLIAAFIGSYLILRNPVEAGTGSFLGMLVESINIKFRKEKIDDNLLIPIVSGAGIWTARMAISVIL
jgi:dolichol kinase